jgi:twitching motility protein PilI
MSLATPTRLTAMSQLLNLEERVRLSGATLPRSVDSRERFAGLRCNVVGLNCVLPLNDVAEVLEHRTLTGIPGCAAWVKGVVNLRGRLLPVFDVNEFFACKSSNSGPLQIIVVDNGRLLCGLAVTRLLGMRKFYRESFCIYRENDIQHKPAQQLGEFVEAVAVLDESTWYQLNIEKLAGRIIQTSPASSLNRV